MKLESLKVHNIRSMKDLEIEFPESTVLFFGDIGSGKSSVLKAIEFALFGTMGELPGSSLLRRGEKKGFAELEFSVDGNKFTFHRELKTVIRKGEEAITQPQGWLIENGVKTAYTTTELRIKILEILNYSISNYKNTNRKCIDLYRYTVYTPQEEIKKILVTDPEERFGILKDVLEIEKYENTLSNLERVKKQLMKDITDLDIRIKGIGSPKEEIPEKKKEIDVLTKDIGTLKKNLSEKKKESTKEKEEQAKIQKNYTEFSKKISAITSKQKSIKEDTGLLKRNEQTVLKLSLGISEKTEGLKALPQLKLKTKLGEEELDIQIKSFQEKSNEIRDEKTLTQKNISNVDELLKNGKCSLCGQEIHEKERFDEEFALAQKQLQDLEKDYNEIQNKKKEAEKLIKNVRDYSKYIQKRNGIQELLKEKQIRMTELVKANRTLSEKIELFNNEIKDILTSYKIKSLDEVKKYEEDFDARLKAQGEKVDSTQEELTKLEKDLSSFETQLKGLEKDLQDLNELDKRKEILKVEYNKMESIKEWVSDQLPILIKDIERTILKETSSEFNRYFKEWFKILVENENIDIEISPEDFQPKVIMNGYNSPFVDMSGGEQSALSLAYRLALNKVINIKFQDVKTKDLLILDEPTDGFSEQQVVKMQDVFDTLNTKQMIIISHGRTLDSFVTDIFNFKKINRQTKVIKEQPRN